MRPALLTALLLSIASIIGCEADPETGGALVGDSAGVTIVDHGPIDVRSLPRWALAGEPTVGIGVIDGPEEYQLHRVTDAHRRRDGSIAILDGSRTLRVYGPDGTLRWRTGGEGEGPGEFGYPQKVMELPGDSLVVWDPGLGRFTVVVDPGEMIRTRTVESTTGTTAAVGLADSDRILVDRRPVERGVIDGRPALTRRSEFLLLDVSEGRLHFIGRRHFATDYQEVQEGGAWSPAIFDVSAVSAPAPGGFWYGDADAYELRRTTRDEGVVRVLRWTGPDRAFDDTDVDAALEVWAGGESATPELRRWMAEYGRTHPRARRFPAYEELLTDAHGNVWVRDFVRDHEDDGMRRWTVFSSDGARVLGRLEHGEELELLRVDPEWVLGVERDELDVERVVVRGVVPAGGR